MAALQAQLDQTRQDLADAFERARAVNYQPGSAQLAALDAAERRYRHAQSLWQDRRRPDADSAASSTRAAGGPPDTVIDLTSDRRVDLDGQPSLDVPPSDGQRLNGQGPEQ